MNREMKTVSTIIAILFLIGTTLPCEAQIKVPVKKKVVDKTNREANQATDEAIDEGFNQVKGLFKKKNKKSDNGQQPSGETQDQNTPVNQPQTAGGKDVSGPTLNWAKYDFVPGDVVIFEDDLSGEENGEFPSRWDLVRGVAEVAEIDGENVIMFREGEPSITPYFKDAEADHLPDVFTVEFDLYYPGNGNFEVYLFDRKNQKSGSPTGYTYLQITNNHMQFGQSGSDYPSAGLAKARWMHVAIAYTKGKLKAYMDDTRLINMPRIDFDPKGITLYTYHASNDNLYYVKNVRIARGGVKYYDRFLQDGKIVATGIKFETNKATLKPESMGIINNIFKIMQDHPDLKFSVEGHTDNVGDEDFNMKLSLKRAETVRDKLISMGITSDRFTVKGFGETVPATSNDTPEGRANNRRVEFVRMGNI